MCFLYTKADIEISFRLSGLKEAEEMNVSWIDPQLLCKENEALGRGAIGPFGLLVLASKDLTEQTAVYFRVFRKQYDKYVVLMCSDQSRFVGLHIVQILFHTARAIMTDAAESQFQQVFSEGRA